VNGPRSGQMEDLDAKKERVVDEEEEATFAA
jgi:nitrogen fixation-related uncharacterized protein